MIVEHSVSYVYSYLYFESITLIYESPTCYLTISRNKCITTNLYLQSAPVHTCITKEGTTIINCVIEGNNRHEKWGSFSGEIVWGMSFVVVIEGSMCTAGGELTPWIDTPFWH